MAGIFAINSKGYIPVVLDDIIASGATISAILKDLDDYIQIQKDIYPYLCISDCYTELDIEEFKERGDTRYEPLMRFETIICNKFGI